MLSGYLYSCMLFIVDNFLSPNSFIPLFYIFFTYFRHLGINVCLPLHKNEGKGKRNQKLIHVDTGIECHLSTRQENKWSLLKKKRKKR